MTLSAAQVERAEWRDRRGCDWSRRWTRTTGSSSLDLESLCIQIRAGGTEDAPLVASTADVDGVALITTAGSDFGSLPVLAWQVAADETARIPAGEYVIEARCRVDGVLRTIFRHSWGVDPRVVVPA